VQFSIRRLLLAMTATAAAIGLAQLGHLNLVGAAIGAGALGGIVLLTGKSGLRPNDPRVSGFSPRRIAWATAVLSWLLVPMHGFVSCGMSERLAAASMLLLLITGGLGLVNRNGMSLRALVLAILGLMANMLFTH
jgi:hypothetical protein